MSVICVLDGGSESDESWLDVEPVSSELVVDDAEDDDDVDEVRLDVGEGRRWVE